MTEINRTQSGIAWQKIVVAEHAQSDSVREEMASDDFWRPVAHKFVPPKKGDSGPDDTIQKLVEFITKGETVLDVGAGGGTDLSITKEVNPNCSLNALECFNPNITSLESKGISVNNINIENNLFSSMSWGIYLLLEKVKVYQNDFVEFPKNENLEINFYAG